MCKQISISLLFLLPLKVAAATQPTALELLDKYAANQDKLKSFIARTEVVTTHLTQDVPAQQARVDRYLVEFRYDGSDSDLRVYYNWTDLKLGDDGTWVPEDRSTTWLWDGKWSYEYHRAGALDSSSVYIISGVEYTRRGLAVLYSGAGPILGILYGDLDRFDSILRQSDSISVRGQLERVGPVDCYVIDAKCKQHGTYAVWLDPQHGYGIAKAAVHKGPEDLLHGRRPSSYINTGSYKGQRLFVENVRFQNIEGVWIPMEADDRIVTEEQNKTSSSHTHYRIAQIDIDPNHAELQSFAPNIQNGTSIRVMGAPGIEYMWQEGMQFVVDEWDGSIKYVPKDWAILVAVGKPLPKLDGIELTLTAEQTENRAILLCFLDMNQRPSRHCITQLAQKAAELKERGVIVVAVQATQVEEKTLSDWTKKYNISFPVGTITADVEKTRFAWGVRSLPWLILADKKHVVRVQGFAVSELDGEVERIKAGEVQP